MPKGGKGQGGRGKCKKVTKVIEDALKALATKIHEIVLNRFYREDFYPASSKVRRDLRAFVKGDSFFDYLTQEQRDELERSISPEWLGKICADKQYYVMREEMPGRELDEEFAVKLTYTREDVPPCPPHPDTDHIETDQEIKDKVIDWLEKKQVLFEGQGSELGVSDIAWERGELKLKRGLLNCLVHQLKQEGFLCFSKTEKKGGGKKTDPIAFNVKKYDEYKMMPENAFRYNIMKGLFSTEPFADPNMRRRCRSLPPGGTSSSREIDHTISFYVNPRTLRKEAKLQGVGGSSSGSHSPRSAVSESGSC